MNNAITNSAVLPAGCTGSQADKGILVPVGFALRSAVATARPVSSHEVRSAVTFVEFPSGKAVCAAWLGGLEFGGGYAARLRDLQDAQAQTQVDAQRMSVLSGTRPMTPTTGMTAAKRGASGPHPWWQPVH